jgi:5'-3' exonuclease
MSKGKTALIDLDAMLHVVANVQLKAGNRDMPTTVKNHIRTFIANIEKSCGCQSSIKFYQGIGHKNYRNVIMPEYKGHRVPSEAIKLWKPTIMEAFKESGAHELKYIESDDAIALIAGRFNPKDIVIISSDKDMIQVPGTHYNPYKRNSKDPKDRWSIATYASASKFLWAQVLAGDPTDMPNALCGLPGVGVPTAFKMLDSYDIDVPHRTVIQDAYTKKYGSKEGFIRANRTYKMVKLLTEHGCDYLIDHSDATLECTRVLTLNSTPIIDEVADLFDPPTITLNFFK